jgi:hypothetical protein
MLRLSERKTRRKTTSISSASRELRHTLKSERESNNLRSLPCAFSFRSYSCAWRLQDPRAFISTNVGIAFAITPNLTGKAASALRVT